MRCSEFCCLYAPCPSSPRSKKWIGRQYSGQITIVIRLTTKAFAAALMGFVQTGPSQRCSVPPGRRI